MSVKTLTSKNLLFMDAKIISNILAKNFHDSEIITTKKESVPKYVLEAASIKRWSSDNGSIHVFSGKEHEHKSGPCHAFFERTLMDISLSENTRITGVTNYLFNFTLTKNLHLLWIEKLLFEKTSPFKGLTDQGTVLFCKKDDLVFPIGIYFDVETIRKNSARIFNLFIALRYPQDHILNNEVLKKYPFWFASIYTMFIGSTVYFANQTTIPTSIGHGFYESTSPLWRYAKQVPENRDFIGMSGNDARVWGRSTNKDISFKLIIKNFIEEFLPKLGKETIPDTNLFLKEWEANKPKGKIIKLTESVIDELYKFTCKTIGEEKNG